MVLFLEDLLDKWKSRISIAITFRNPPLSSKQFSTTVTTAIAPVDKICPSAALAMEFTLQITRLPPPYDGLLLELDEDIYSACRDDFLPSYKEHRRSPRCEEDIYHPAPSYKSHFMGAQPSGADKLADWLVARTRSTRKESLRGTASGSVQRRRSVLTLRR